LRAGDWNDISYGVTHGSQKQVSISGVGDEALNLVLPNQGSDLFVRKAADSAHRQERPLLMVGLKETDAGWTRSSAWRPYSS
jgi:hypothetical protein